MTTVPQSMFADQSQDPSQILMHPVATVWWQTLLLERKPTHPPGYGRETGISQGRGQKDR